MKICEAISQINSLKPNTYSDKQKIYWLNQLESMVKRLVIDTHEGGDQIAFDGFNENTSVETQLFMPSPFDMAYIYWLEAQIHYANGEFARYNNAIALYNTEWVRLLRRHFRSRTGERRYFRF